MTFRHSPCLSALETGKEARFQLRHMRGDEKLLGFSSFCTLGSIGFRLWASLVSVEELFASFVRFRMKAFALRVQVLRFSLPIYIYIYTHLYVASDAAFGRLALLSLGHSSPD